MTTSIVGRVGKAYYTQLCINADTAIAIDCISPSYCVEASTSMCRLLDGLSNAYIGR